MMSDKLKPVYLTASATAYLSRFAPQDRATIRAIAIAAARNAPDASATEIEIGVMPLKRAYTALRAQQAAAKAAEQRETFSFTGQAMLALHSTANQWVRSNEQILEIMRTATGIARAAGRTTVTSEDVREAHLTVKR